MSLISRATGVVVYGIAGGTALHIYGVVDNVVRVVIIIVDAVLAAVPVQDDFVVGHQTGLAAVGGVVQVVVQVQAIAVGIVVQPDMVALNPFEVRIIVHVDTVEVTGKIAPVVDGVVRNALVVAVIAR